MVCGPDSPKEIRYRHDRSERWGTCDTGGYRARPMRPSSMLVTWTRARHPPSPAASLLRTVRAVSYGPAVPAKAGQLVARWTIPPSPRTVRPFHRRGRGLLLPRPPSSQPEWGKGHGSHRSPPGVAFRGAVTRAFLNRERRQWGARRIVLADL